jgi:hypothetical protein
MNNTFFGNEGITMTSANHLCNLAKERIECLSAEWQNVHFVDIIMSTTNIKAQSAVGRTDVKGLEETLEDIAKLRAFIAYMREAIKRKNDLFGNAELLKKYSYDWPTKPECPRDTTFEEIFETLSIKEQNEYWAVESECITYGKMIHPGMPFAAARKELLDSLAKPAILDGNYVYSRKPTISVSKVEDAFFALQSKHRAAEARLNAIKHSIDKRVEAENLEKSREYQQALEEYYEEYNKINAEFSTWKKEERARIEALKIIIPNALKSTYEYLTNL